MTFSFTILNISFLTGFIIFVFMLYVSYVFFKENERRPAIISFLSACLILITYSAIAFLLKSNITAYISVILPTAVLLIFTIPIRYKSMAGTEDNDLFLDERDVMFSRAELIPGTDRFDSYYKLRPENKNLDDKFRSKAGLLSNQSQKYEPLKFACADGNFEAVEAFKYLRETSFEKNADKQDVDSKEASLFIRNWMKQSGAVSVGFTPLKNHHIYKVSGRGENYGKKINIDHPNAIAITVEMDKSMIDKAPNAETVMESSQQYFKSAALVAQLTHFIRKLGYFAKPHFDGNYDVVCPTIARDAGLGELGRMGILMSHELGPRVRIAVVTTDLPVEFDSRNSKPSMIEFCKICKKCADNCPANAISFEDIQEESGMKRWTINHEACFTFWSVIGTDCAKCMQVCPYSHPDNFLHNLIRKGINNSKLFAQVALKADDLFYGRKPKKN